LCTNVVKYTILKLEKFFRKFADIFASQGAPPVSTTPVANCRRYQRHRQQICQRYQQHRRQILPPVPLVLLTPVVNLPLVSTKPAANLPPVSTTPVANCHWYQRHRRQTLSCEYLREFSKKFETVLMEYSGVGGKLIHEKNQKQKIS
jgi:hypothetical protein